MKTRFIMSAMIAVVLATFALPCVSVRGAVDVEMILNDGGFVSFDHFKAELYLNNRDIPVVDAWIFGILDIEGEFYYWPAFDTEVSYDVRTIGVGESRILFLEFDFPDIDDIMPYGPMYFWGAWYVDDARYGYDVKEFWLDGAHKWTPTPSPTPPPMNFVYVPPGTFTMGSPSDEMCRDTDETRHQVTLTRGFHIQQTEVTQQQWVEVFGSNLSGFAGMNRPAERVTWFDACVFCNRLSVAQGLTPCYYTDASFTTMFDETPPVTSGTVYWNREADGYRLPTESEWEYACRAGTTAAYSSGETNTSCSEEDTNLNPLAWYKHNSDTGNGKETHPAGLKQANAWGLLDMYGNVWEWCWDWYSASYPSGSVTDPTGPATGTVRVIRGGGWNSRAESCRSAGRTYSAPCYHYNNLGFRLAKNDVSARNSGNSRAD